MVKRNRYLSCDQHTLFCNIWVTSFCNFACKYCYESTDKPEVYMSRETADQTLQFLETLMQQQHYDGIWLNFHGGEPMLNADIIKYITDETERRGYRIYTSMTTNCSVRDAEICDYIDELTVSLDGDQTVHDRNRVTRTGKGTFQLVIDNARYYLEHAENTRLRMVVRSDNVSNLARSVQYLYGLGFRVIIPGLDYFDPDWTEALFDQLLEQYQALYRWRIANVQEEATIGTLDETIKPRGKCAVGCDGYQIAQDGKIYPCTYITGKPEYCIGDVRSGIDPEAVRRINCAVQQEVPACSGCANTPYCIAQRCLILNQQLTGELTTPSAILCAEENMKQRLWKYIRETGTGDTHV